MFAANFALVACLIGIPCGIFVEANPQLDMLVSGYEMFGICVKNCAQCKKLYGAYFEGQRCAESCIKDRGSNVPDCEDLASIAPFLNTLEAQNLLF
ncbi:eclosion hormone-like [Anopheles cruzii]|uniref:eclosion hormone-like n=1 Tax=Anopheles cruzii TaxID=68878 RepID=UPI0022EC716E|nr:eclosion hormone-like [Anopheles cruzii]